MILNTRPKIIKKSALEKLHTKFWASQNQEPQVHSTVRQCCNPTHEYSHGI